MATTTDVNRYAPPRAEVGDLATDGVQPIRLWPPRGRLGRMRFFVYPIALYLVAFVIGIVSALIGERGGIIAIGLTWIVYIVGIAVLAIQRSHDMNWAGWTCIGAFVPLVNLIWVFKAGSPGRNDYGAPPPPNSTGLKVLFWILIALTAALNVVFW